MTLKVGIYDQPQVRNQQTPGGRLNVSVPNFGAAPAQALGEVADTMGKLADKEDSARLADAKNQMILLDAQTKAEIAKQQGENALRGDPNDPSASPFKPTLDSRAARVQSITDGLGNQRQKELFGKLAKEHDTEIGAHIINWQLQQGEAVKNQVVDGAITAAKQAIQADPTSQATYNDTMAHALSTYADRAADLGIAPELRDARIAEINSSLLATRITTLLPTDVTLAKKLLDENGDILVGDERKQVTHEVNIKFTATAGDALADRLFDPKGKLADQLAALRSDPMANANPDVIKAGEAALKDRWSVHDFDRREAVSHGTDTIDGMVMAGKLSTQNHGIYNQAVLIGMPEKEATALQLYWEYEARARALHNRQMADHLSPEQRKANADLVADLTSNADRLAKTPRSALDDARAQLTPELWTHVLTVRQHYIDNPAALRDATVDANAVSVALAQSKYISDANPTGDKEKAILKSAQSFVIGRLNDLRAQGVVVTPEVRNKEISNAMLATVEQERMWGMLSPKLVPGWKADMGKVPVPAEYAEAYTEEIGHVSKEVIAAAYLRNPGLFANRPKKQVAPAPATTAPAQLNPTTPAAPPATLSPRRQSGVSGSFSLPNI